MHKVGEFTRMNSSKKRGKVFFSSLVFFSRCHVESYGLLLFTIFNMSKPPFLEGKGRRYCIFRTG